MTRPTIVSDYKQTPHLHKEDAEDDEAAHVQDVLRQVLVGRVRFLLVLRLLPTLRTTLVQPRHVPRAVEGGVDGGVQQIVAVAATVVVQEVDVAGVGVLIQGVAVAGQVGAAVGRHLLVVVVVLGDCNGPVLLEPNTQAVKENKIQKRERLKRTRTRSKTRERLKRTRTRSKHAKG